jgi:hypothetical protein
MLFSERLPAQYAATWAVGWLGMQGFVMPTESDVIGRLFLFCQQKDQPEFTELAIGALIRQPFGPRETKQHCRSISLQEFLSVMHGYGESKHEMKVALLIVAWYLAALSDKEIIENASEMIKLHPSERDPLNRPIRKILDYLGAGNDKAVNSLAFG